MSVGGSEGPVMRNTDALFGMGLGGATSPSPATHGMRVAYSAADGTAIYKSATPPPGSSLSPPPPAAAPENHHHQYSLSYQQQQQPMMMMKKKRGRPRKYNGGVGGTDVAMPLALMPPAAAAAQPAAAAAPPQTAAGGESGGPTFKKARGRPPGSTNKIKPLQHHFQPIPLSGSSTAAAAAAGSAGVGFTPHVISVKAGEDVSSKIMSFSQNGPRAVCILSANGAISNVTLRQAATSGGTATYEGRFEILSLCGSFMLTEVGGHRSRTGGLSVSLAGPDGRVLGGCVAGLLTAASPVQVIVGSFIPDGRKEFTKAAPQNHHADPTSRQQIPIPMPMPMSMSVMSPPVPFSSSSGGGGGYTGGAAAAGGGVRSPPSDDGGGSLIGESSSGEEEEEDEEEEGGGEGGSPPPNHHHTTGGTASNNNHHHHQQQQQQQQHHTNSNNTNNPHAMLGMPWR